MADGSRTGAQRPPAPLFWQLFLPNAAVLAAAAVFLMLSPATIGHPVSLDEALALVAGLVAMLVLNLVLIRHAVAPLEQLTRLMARVDPLRPGTRVSRPRGSAETVELASVFNAMAARLEAERRESSRRSLLAQEHERLRLARELHDEIGQTVTSVMLELDRIAQRVEGEPRAELAELREQARALSDSLREVVRGLRPEALDDLGLHAALVALSRRFSEQSGISVLRSFEAPADALDPEVEMAIYRIAQECLANVARHSGASEVRIELTERDGALVLRVADDGRGIGDAEPGYGIQGMRERALLIGGELRFVSPAGGGLAVELEVPLGRREEDEG